ncbi:hypothetical protein CERSUDRAFT_95027 [Gelatoporia subvermispora B]|uniref:C2 NT-type domain-containing protein n=1 Tax=Ceriporiopsis subvermispora (strain B) TaxID=914234 RepID=M2QI89_CERS8|nr:hypothetical protein CERSUDRAFT_95027 [Gelatoporia subvermispora B]
MMPAAPRPSTSHSSTSSDVSTTNHGLRSQLGQLLPKHALFQVRLHIDQLSNVPLISGQVWFACQDEGAALALGDAGEGKGKGKERAVEPMIEVTLEDGSGHSADIDGDNSAHEDDTHDHDHASLAVPDADSSNVSAYGEFLTASPPGTPSLTPTPIRADSSSSSAQSQSEARGITPWTFLKNYNVKWQHTVNVLVQMDVHRETSDLLPNELKLVVMQRVIPGDPDSPRQPRLGAIYLNLAEYVDAGPVTRQYLLRQSKTNATLKLTIELEHAGGEKHYKAPPLHKGEILASVSGLLTNNELLRMPLTRELDRYTNGELCPPEEEEDSASEYDPSTARPRYNPFADEQGHLISERLANSRGLHATENLIEALFNPVPSASPMQTPFTYYSPRESERTNNGDGGADTSGDSLTNGSGAERRSIASSRTSTGDSFASNSAASMYTSASGSDRSSVSVNGLALEVGPETKPNKHWWQKLRSHPNQSNTAITRRFQPAAPFTPPEVVVSHR